MKQESAYKRLPGRGVTWGGPSRVWLGADHILLVLQRGYFEHYRRFFFGDIQAITVQKTHIGKIWTAVWLSLFLFFGLIAVLVNNSIGSPILAAVAAPFGLALLANLLLGPTCALQIRTAVQTERLPAVSRVRAAQKLIALVEPLISSAQAQLAQERVTTPSAEAPPAELQAPTPEAAPAQPAPPAAAENVPPVIGP